MTEEEKLDAGLPYDFCESGCKLRKNRTVFYALTNRAARDNRIRDCIKSKLKN